MNILKYKIENLIITLPQVEVRKLAILKIQPYCIY